MHKRKHRRPDREKALPQPHLRQSYEDPCHEFDPSLYIVAHEADIVPSERAISAALALECPDTRLRDGDKTGIGSALVSLDTRFDMISCTQGESTQPSCWVDRYDVRLLLQSLPSHTTAASPPATQSAAVGHVAAGSRSLSPTGWTDLPSDAEDTFFLSPEETEDYRRDKRRRMIDRSREERLRALAAASETGAEGDPVDEWGGSDEEPDDAQKELLRRTAVHIISSPNPAQLEMRILANHGADRRFAFLRGRWKKAWTLAKETVRQQEEQARKMEQPVNTSSIPGLVGYGDSDESGNESGVKMEAGSTAKTLGGCDDDEEVRKKARRERAREWSSRRRATQLSDEGNEQR